MTNKLGSIDRFRAIDFSEKMIAIATEKANQQKISNVTFEKASIDELKIPPQSLEKRAIISGINSASGSTTSRRSPLYNARFVLLCCYR